MIVKKYLITIGSGPLSVVHTWDRRNIEEYYIPEFDLTINSEAEFFGDRSDKGVGVIALEIDIPVEFIRKLAEAVANKKEYHEKISALLF